MNKNYYNILSVDKNATQDEIKKAFRELSKKYHPDKNPGNKEAENMFKDINEAYSILGDENKRKQYDFEQNGFNPFMSGGFRNGFRSSWQFGQMASDIQMKLSITLEESYYGCEKPIRVGMKHLNVKIPKGTLPNQKLRISGYGVKGMSMYGEEVTGDLIIIVHVQNTDNMWLNEDGTLETMYSLDWLDSILGSEQTLDLFDKEIKFKTPKFCQNGGYSIKSNCGWPKKDGTCGTIKFNYIIRMPKTLNSEQLKLVEKIKEGNNQ